MAFLTTSLSTNNKCTGSGNKMYILHPCTVWNRLCLIQSEAASNRIFDTRLFDARLFFFMRLLSSSLSVLWKHLPLICHGVTALMNMAPCILTNATFNLASPLCSQNTSGTEPQKKTLFLCVWLQKLPLLQAEHEVAHCVITELDIVLVKQQDPRCKQRRDV